jgi:hypothetical protein
MGDRGAPATNAAVVELGPGPHEAARSECFAGAVALVWPVS